MAVAELRVEQDIIDLIQVSTAWNEKEQIKAIPGSRWDPTGKVWTLPLTYAACVQLKGQFSDKLSVGPLLTQWIWDEFNSRVKPSLDIRESTESSAFPHSKLYDFQRAGVTFLMTASSALLGDEMGTGKTIQVLAAMDCIGLDNSLPAIVIAPNSVKANWADEAKKWLPLAIPYVLTGSAANKAKMIEDARTNPRALVITNYESTHRLSRLAGFGSIRLARCVTCDPKYGIADLKAAQCEVHPRILNQVPFKTVIADEAHRLKDPKAKQTRAAWAISTGKTVQRRWALTGTPLANDPSDLWSIMHFVEPSEYPTKSKFTDLYCLQAWNNFGGLTVVGLNPLRKDEFYRFFDPRFRRMSKALVLQQLPPKVRTIRGIEMTPKQKKAYDEVSKRLITRLDDGTVLIAANNLSAQVRLLQLSSSYCTIEGSLDQDDISGWTVELREPSPKLDELMDVLDELGDKPCVVAAESRRLIELAAIRLDKAGISYGLITGAIDEYSRREALKAFQNGELRVLLFTIKAGGVGLTMTAADTIIFLQRSWSMIDNKQAEDRVHRIGSEKHNSVQIIDLVTKDTVEVTQLARLGEKMQRLDEITRDRAALQKARLSVAHLDDEESKILDSNLGLPE